MTVSLDTTGEERAVLEYKGDYPYIVEEVRSLISQSPGLYGHLIGNETAALDLAVAVKSLPRDYEIELIEGKEPSGGTEELPDNAFT